MATIANQIQRIASARNTLRTKGKALGLQVPEGNYWDDSTDSYKSYQAAPLNDTDQIDKIAAAFNNITAKLGTEIKVPITVVTDGTTTTVESYQLETGFYAGATIVPFIKVQEVDDIVINVEMVSDRLLTAQQGTITPTTGFNYIGQFGYTIQSGKISVNNQGFGDGYVNAVVETSGWVDKDAVTKINVTQSAITSKVGTNAATTVTSGDTIIPSPDGETTITITSGIAGTNRTLIIPSVSSQTTGDAKAEDILSGKTAWVNGVKVSGTMPNYGGTSASAEKNTAATGLENIGGKLAIAPAKGYYNEFSNITTDIVYNPTRVFGTETNNATVTDTMTAKVYYETIPAGYYSEAIKRKIEVQSGAGEVKIDYTNHKATFNVTKAGWISSNVTVDISAGPAVYAQTEEDLAVASHSFVITPAKDTDGEKTSYLTQVTVDNQIIFDLLAAI